MTTEGANKEEKSRSILRCTGEIIKKPWKRKMMMKNKNKTMKTKALHWMIPINK